MPTHKPMLLVFAAAVASCQAHWRRTSSTGDFGLSVNRLQHQVHSDNLGATGECGNVTTNYFAGAVKDNFAAASQQEPWDGQGQRYFVNDQFWGGPGSPIFVYIGGEGPESCYTLQPGALLMSQLAEQHNALMLDVEHRYYGESHPTDDMSNENLAKYLTSEQALADLARIVAIEAEERRSSTVVSFGGSYPGNLAAWFRLKYPHITHASVASSAPLRAELDFYQYMEVVTDSLEFWTGSCACNDALKEAVADVVKLADQGPASSGYAQLAKDFSTCSALQSQNDVAVLFSDLMGNIQGTVQYNRESSRARNVTDICEVLTQSGSTPYENFVNLSQQFSSEMGPCEDASYENYIGYLANATLDPANNMRPWTYQTCNEFGYFQTATSAKTPWHGMESYLSKQFYLDICKAAFGGLANEPDVDGTNRHYGADRIAATDVLFPNGSLDPWHVLGVFGQPPPLPQPSERTVFINGTAHCADMRAMAATPQPSDPLYRAQLQIQKQVGCWLSTPGCEQ